MIYLTMTVVVVLFITFMLIVMNIIEGKIRRRNNEKIIWRIKEMDKRDRVVTRTGGLENDRLNERQ
jgi:preprotein translocase subunit YajC